MHTFFLINDFSESFLPLLKLNDINFNINLILKMCLLDFKLAKT